MICTIIGEVHLHLSFIVNTLNANSVEIETCVKANDCSIYYNVTYCVSKPC